MNTKAFNIGTSQFAKSDGFVLLLIVLTLLGVGAVVFLTGIGANLAGSERAQKRTTARNDQLQAAKQMLIGYVISPPNIGYRPGTLPTPDSLANGTYDGTEDSQCLGTGTNGLPALGSTALTKRCLGRLPWKALGFEVSSTDANDPLGNIPWLAVSANLVYYSSCLSALNSEAMKLASPAMATCPSPLYLPTTDPRYPQPTSLPDSWLTVVDANGVELSKRVAAVLIMPGPPVITETRTQQRSEANPGHPNAHLDDIKVPLGCTSGCTTFDNAGLTNVFIFIPPGTKYPTDAQDVSKRGQPIAFNDQLVYITIDELIPFIERRVAGHMATSLKTFKSSGLFSPSAYPWMAPFDAAPSLTTSLTSGAGTIFGMFPFMSETAAASQSDYRTDFDWGFTGFSEALTPTCQRIGNGPNRYVRNTLSNATGTTPLDKGVCQWRSANRVSCSLPAGQTITTTAPKSMAIYSDNNCTVQVGNNTLNVSRVVTSLIIDASCVSPFVTYIAATSGDVHRWSTSCASIVTSGPPSSPPGLALSTVSFDATDTISNTGSTSYSRLPRTVSVSLNAPIGSNKQVVTTRMRYHPKMPVWFHENLWYRTAFAAVAPAAAPFSTPCTGGVTTLTAGARQGIEALVIQAGPRLVAVNPGTRPSMVIADYLEGQNPLNKGGAAPGMTNCIFDGASAPQTTIANDQLIVVSP